MRQIETTFFDLANLVHTATGRSVLIICDRGLLDPSACGLRTAGVAFSPPFRLALPVCSRMVWNNPACPAAQTFVSNIAQSASLACTDCPAEDWQRMLEENGWNNVALRDERYQHVVHMVCCV